MTINRWVKGYQLLPYPGKWAFNWLDTPKGNLVNIISKALASEAHDIYRHTSCRVIYNRNKKTWFDF